jgi:hypothetical protein
MTEPLELKDLNLPKTDFAMKASLPQNRQAPEAWQAATSKADSWRARVNLCLLHDGRRIPPGRFTWHWLNKT